MMEEKKNQDMNMHGKKSDDMDMHDGKNDDMHDGRKNDGDDCVDRHFFLRTHPHQ